MKKLSFPAWVVYIIGFICVVAAFYATYKYGFKKGDEQILCAPDVNWSSDYMRCYEAAFDSGVMCPCGRGFMELGTCLDILDNKSFTQEEKLSKVRAEFGETWAQPFPAGSDKWMHADCEKAGICPKGQCVAWEGACYEAMEQRGYEQKDEEMRQCCVSVMPE